MNIGGNIIDKELFDKIAIDTYRYYGQQGLYNNGWKNFAYECCKKYLKAVDQAIIDYLKQ